MQKFENVDIIKYLNEIMQIHTKYYQSDFEIDVENLTQAVKKQNLEDRVYLWICRPAGTWCLRERDTFIKGTCEYNIFCFYAEHTQDKILIYAVELISMEKNKVMGNIYELDYLKYYEHVREVSVECGETKLIYENGERKQTVGRRIVVEDNPYLGKFLSFEDQPKDLDALCSVLQKEKSYRAKFKCGDIKTHIEMLCF